MKITFVLEHACMAGGIRVVAIYADRLKKLGHDVVVVSTPRKPLPLKRKFGSLARGHGWPAAMESKEPSHLDDVDVNHRVLPRYRPITDADVPDADVVIATWWETAEWVNALSPRKGAKAHLIQHHELLFENQPKDRVAATWRMPLHKITISKWLTDLAMHTYGDHSVSHVPNSVDLVQFHAPLRNRQARPTVGFLYNPTPFKGCNVAIEAINRAASQLDGLRVVSFGNFPISDAMPLPTNTDFTLRPPQNRIRDIYARCDVWVCGSQSEGFHLPPLEAMACRCPVVSTRVGGPADVIREGVNGYLVDIGDAAALANRLVKVMRLSPDHWQAMSDAAYVTAALYTWEDAAKRLEAALEIAIRRSHRAASGQRVGSAA